MLTPAAPGQNTLKTAIRCTGVGLHTGKRAVLTLRPAPADTGMLFRRLDAGAGGIEIPAHWSNAVESALCTTLADSRGITISTIEHLMAALAGCGIDNCVIEIDGPEVPILDGSAESFVFLIECAGIVAQPAPRRAIRVLKRIEVGDERAWASLEPDDQFTIDFEIEFPQRPIGRQLASFVVEPAEFKSEICRARTFGFLADVDRLRAAGRALGASLDNAIVIDGDRVLNPGGLRYPDEFVRHKVLDALGDLALAGGPLIGRFTGWRSSHALNWRLLQALFSDPAAWTSSDLAPALEPAAARWSEPARARA